MAQCDDGETSDDVASRGRVDQSNGPSSRDKHTPANLPLRYEERAERGARDRSNPSHTPQPSAPPGADVQPLDTGFRDSGGESISHILSRSAPHLGKRLRGQADDSTPQKRNKYNSTVDDVKAAEDVGADLDIDRRPGHINQAMRLSTLGPPRNNTQTILASFMEEVLNMREYNRGHPAAVILPDDTRVEELLNDLFRVHLGLGIPTDLGTEIIDKQGLLRRILGFNYESIWAISLSATSVPAQLEKPLHELFWPGMCFWDRNAQHARDQTLSLGNDAAPAAGGMICTKRRVHVVIKVFGSRLLTSTTGTHQGRKLEDVRSVPIEERAHYFDVIDSRELTRYHRKPEGHAPLLVITPELATPFRPGVTINAADISPFTPSPDYEHIGDLDDMSMKVLNELGTYLRQMNSEAQSPSEGYINWEALKTPRIPARSPQVHVGANEFEPKIGHTVESAARSSMTISESGRREGRTVKPNEQKLGKTAAQDTASTNSRSSRSNKLHKANAKHRKGKKDSNSRSSLGEDFDRPKPGKKSGNSERLRY